MQPWRSSNNGDGHPDDASSWIEIGSIRSIHPVRRTVRVQARHEHEHEFTALTWMRVRFANQSMLRCKVAHVKITDRDVLITLTPGTPRDRITDMRGAHIVLLAEECHEPPESEWPLPALEGMTVVDANASVLGVVTTVYTTAANHAILVEKPQGGELLLPLIKEIVLSIDVDTAQIQVGDIAAYVVDEEE